MRWGRVKPPVEYLFHAAPECTFDDINAEGITNWGAGVYLASTPEDAVRFTSWKLYDHAHQEGMVFHDEIDVWTVHVPSVISGGRWQKGTDHTAWMLGVRGDSWMFSGDIPREAIHGVVAYVRGSVGGVAT